MSTTAVKASGLTCGHCAMSVREEISEIAGVSGVEVDVVAGGESTVTISHEGELDSAAVESAIREAGFTPVS